MENHVFKQFENFISTPTLWINEKFCGLNQFLFKFRSTALTDPENDFVDLQLTNVLGKRAETFFEHAVKSSNHYKILASRVQIIEEKITLGELDFLLKDQETNQTIHVELVYKFYIYDPSFPKEMQRWIGPNRRDSLLLKINKLKNHQLPLLYQNKSKATLQELWIDTENIEQKVFFPANLFVPKHLLETSFPFINNECITRLLDKQKEFYRSRLCWKLIFYS
ncbi:DUF1853 family protein [Antarcticibacterium sp. 1MA-6-2]|uniref:DUF1853 family protein n=1 Tax=Antarcticibacterium sp. 1MA-6-2 TaxID=2908210 RepID=UPI001F224FE5|nr:DUF1853 family protein [Antarcticibacterium sp. 1MA-6-2]UJH91562.1 DUF1853 family protein [Antarcticibacterium sp. 1MA-6-2]